MRAQSTAAVWTSAQIAEGTSYTLLYLLLVGGVKRGENRVMRGMLLGCLHRMMQGVPRGLAGLLVDSPRVGVKGGERG